MTTGGQPSNPNKRTGIVRRPALQRRQADTGARRDRPRDARRPGRDRAAADLQHDRKFASASGAGRDGCPVSHAHSATVRAAHADALANSVTPDTHPVTDSYSLTPADAFTNSPPTCLPVPTPTPSPVPTPSPTPSPSPIQPQTGDLRFVDPQNGATVNDFAVIIYGRAAGQRHYLAHRSVLVRRERVVADGRGRWDLAVLLFPGENIFTFRLNGDIATDVTYALLRAAVTSARVNADRTARTGPGGRVHQRRPRRVAPLAADAWRDGGRRHVHAPSGWQGRQPGDRCCADGRRRCLRRCGRQRRLRHRSARRAQGRRH